ncbi:hypothetical protein ON010_g14782 [Phytophthora cinnamomi]|nr:hypothetical protein ON010_g14782 [Phytophthora cinnamomi]
METANSPQSEHASEVEAVNNSVKADAFCKRSWTIVCASARDALNSQMPKMTPGSLDACISRALANYGVMGLVQSVARLAGKFRTRQSASTTPDFKWTGSLLPRPGVLDFDHPGSEPSVRCDHVVWAESAESELEVGIPESGPAPALAKESMESQPRV